MWCGGGEGSQSGGDWVVGEGRSVWDFVWVLMSLEFYVVCVVGGGVCVGCGGVCSMVSDGTEGAVSARVGL